MKNNAVSSTWYLTPSIGAIGNKIIAVNEWKLIKIPFQFHLWFITPPPLVVYPPPTKIPSTRSVLSVSKSAAVINYSQSVNSHLGDHHFRNVRINNIEHNIEFISKYKYNTVAVQVAVKYRQFRFQGESNRIRFQIRLNLIFYSLYSLTPNFISTHHLLWSKQSASLVCHFGDRFSPVRGPRKNEIDSLTSPFHCLNSSPTIENTAAGHRSPPFHHLPLLLRFLPLNLVNFHRKIIAP